MPKEQEPEGSDNEEYEVEFILSSRMTPTGRKYLVKWKNWPDDQLGIETELSLKIGLNPKFLSNPKFENSWEPAENVDAKEHIEEYEALRRSWTQRMAQNSKFYPA